MQHKPQRPYVPHPTPKTTGRVVPESEFRLSRPFVPGAERMQILETASPVAEPKSVASRDESFMPGIEQFVDTTARTVEPPAESRRDVYASELEEEAYELPPVEHFTDPLPSVGEFAPDNQNALIGEGADAMDYGAVGTKPPEPGEAGWVEDDWQQFDWRAAAALGDAPDAAASNDWATTDWDAAPPIPRERRPSAAQAIATALDHIAQRIRDGELALPSTSDLGDPAALAAKLAALLGARS
ncbi:MAG: hypothetical protein ABI408_03695 [Gemmatimonadaceae bacterium]